MVRVNDVSKRLAVIGQICFGFNTSLVEFLDIALGSIKNQSASFWDFESESKFNPSLLIRMNSEGGINPNESEITMI